MSLPQELLDQLLSGYLDEALTVDERARVEQLLESDSEVRRQLQELRELRQSLQVLARLDVDVKLEQGFADRVLGAAVARAREEGLADDHPLVRLAEQPIHSRSRPAFDRPAWRVTAAMIGLAASIAIAIFLMRSDPNQDPSFVASNPDGVQQNREVVAPEQESSLDGLPSESESMLAEVERPVLDQVASSQTTSDPNRPVVGPPESTDGSAVAATGDTNNGVSEIPRSDAIVANERKGNENPGAAVAGPILVLDVKRSESGRTSGAVKAAMLGAGVAPASRKEVGEQIVGFVAKEVDQEVADASVLFLQLPGKQFDLFYRELWADQEGIESVRMTIAMDAPLAKLVNSVQADPTDPTKVQHDATSFELFSKEGLVDQLAQRISELPFPKLDRSGPGATGTGVAGLGNAASGPDVPAQVLLLVR